MSALYRSLQVPVTPADTDHASIVSLAHTHGRLAIVPALKANANKKLETRRIGNILTQAMCPDPSREEASKFDEADARDPAICQCEMQLPAKDAAPKRRAIVPLRACSNNTKRKRKNHFLGSPSMSPKYRITLARHAGEGTASAPGVRVLSHREGGQGVRFRYSMNQLNPNQKQPNSTCRSGRQRRPSRPLRQGVTPWPQKFRGELFTLTPPNCACYFFGMDCHHAPDSPYSPELARPPLRTKTFFDETKLRLDPRRPKTTTYGINSRFRLFSLIQNCTSLSPNHHRASAFHAISNLSKEKRRVSNRPAAFG